MSERTMRRAVFTRYGGPEFLEIVRVPIPAPEKGQVLIRMVAGSVSGGDLQARSGRARILSSMPPGWPKPLGMDVVGTVEEVGADVSSPSVGELVWAAGFGAGSYADYVVMSARDVARVPEGLDPVEAGALPIAATTALLALVDRARVMPGQRVLIRGAGGVGLMAVQVAHARGAHVTALASGATLEGVRAQGADVVEDYRAVAATDARLGAFDVILNMVAGGFEPFRARLAPNGRMLTVTADFAHPVRAFGQIGASARFGGARTRFVNDVPHAADMDCVAEAWARGAVRPVVDSMFPLEEVRAAHARAEERGLLGRVVLTMG